MLPKVRAVTANPETRTKMSRSRQAIMADPVRRDAMFEKINATRATPEVQVQQSESQSRSWKDPVIRARRIVGISRAAKTDKQIAKSLRNLGDQFGCKPNKLEQRYIVLLEEHYPGEWVYTGNGEKVNIIGGKIPDFTHKTCKKIIELYGDYWHQGDDPSERIDHFAQYGYHTLVLWESEKHERVLGKIHDLMNLESEQK